MERLVVVGPYGVGKSSFIHTLSAALQDTAGWVLRPQNTDENQALLARENAGLLLIRGPVLRTVPSSEEALSQLANRSPLFAEILQANMLLFLLDPQTARRSANLSCVVDWFDLVGLREGWQPGLRFVVNNKVVGATCLSKMELASDVKIAMDSLSSVNVLDQDEVYTLWNEVLSEYLEGIG